MASNGARLAAAAAQIAETVRKDEGTIGKLVNDDELYRRATDVARQAEEIATSARQVVEQAKNTFAGFQSKDGPVEGMASSLKQTMDDARKAMSGFADYLISKFSLTPQMTGVMPPGRESAGSPDGEPWDGVALAIFEENNAAKEEENNAAKERGR